LSAGPTRRAVLAASAAAIPLLLTACRGVQVLGSPPAESPDVRLLRSAIAGERLLVARYRTAAGQAGPASRPAAAALSGILAEHEQHLAQLTARLVVPSGAASQPPAATPSVGPLPTGLPAMLGALEIAEQDASDRLASQLLEVPPSLAQLLASISASEATHVPALRSLGRAR
jgi:hypothetical protein